MNTENILLRMSGCRSDSGEPLVLVSNCSASLVDWCATLPDGALVPSSRFECHHALPKRRPPMTQWRVQYPIRVLRCAHVIEYPEGYSHTITIVPVTHTQTEGGTNHGGKLVENRDYRTEVLHTYLQKTLPIQEALTLLCRTVPSRMTTTSAPPP